MRRYSKCICSGPARCRLPAFPPCWRHPHFCPDDCLWILFPFQDSNPFASLVFYWEPLNRQVSVHSWDRLGWAGVGRA